MNTKILIIVLCLNIMAYFAPPYEAQAQGAAVAIEPGKTSFSPWMYDRVFFQSGSKSLDVEQLKTVTFWARFLSQCEDRFVLEGHADDVGAHGYNASLSTARAEVVKQALVSMGIRADRIIVQSFGNSRPAVLATEDQSQAQMARQQNRRVELAVEDIIDVSCVMPDGPDELPPLN
ncbi:MAG TPA: OmpA family protein [Alphaproteobacteria bacterium]|nr:OmpA family protein [Alphaproteobacteria bacterium]